GRGQGAIDESFRRDGARRAGEVLHIDSGIVLCFHGDEYDALAAGKPVRFLPVSSKVAFDEARFAHARGEQAPFAAGARQGKGPLAIRGNTESPPVAQTNRGSTIGLAQIT